MNTPSLVPAAFFDRDGVLIEDSGYPHLEADLILIPGAAEAVRRLNDLGYLCVIVTNQSGVARGLFSLDQMNLFNDLLIQRLGEQGARIDAVYSAPWHRDAVDPAWRHPDHPDRKPNPGMLLKAIADHHIDPARSLMIGDRQSDLDAATAAGVQGFLFGGGDLDAFVRGVLDA